MFDLAPCLSVIMPNYNHAHFIEEALDAIYSQDWHDMEVIVIDDASTDNSIEILEKYKQKFPNFVLLRNKIRMGTNYNCDLGFECSKGKYVYFAGADDKVLPHFFTEGMAMLLKYPQAGLCTSNVYVFSGDNWQQGTEWRYQKLNKTTFFSPSKCISIVNKYSFCIPSTGSIYRKECVTEMGALRAELTSLSDWFLAYSIAFRYGVCYIPKRLSACRITQLNYSLTTCPAKNLAVLFQVISNCPPEIRRGFVKSGLLCHFKKKLLIPYLRQRQYVKYLPSILIRKLFSYLFPLQYISHKDVW